MKIVRSKRNSSELSIVTDEGNLHLMPLQPNIIRCIFTKHDEVINESLMCDGTKSNSQTHFDINDSANCVNLSTDRISLDIQCQQLKD
jgi:hypothetical protein